MSKLGVKMLDKERTIYFAGMFDGDGHIRITTGKAGKHHRRNPSFQLRIGVLNNDNGGWKCGSRRTI